MKPNHFGGITFQENEISQVLRVTEHVNPLLGRGLSDGPAFDKRLAWIDHTASTYIASKKAVNSTEALYMAQSVASKIDAYHQERPGLNKVWSGYDDHEMVLTNEQTGQVIASLEQAASISRLKHPLVYMAAQALQGAEVLYQNIQTEEARQCDQLAIELQRYV